MKSIEGWYETPAHGAKPSFRAPQAMNVPSGWQNPSAPSAPSSRSRLSPPRSWTSPPPERPAGTTARPALPRPPRPNAPPTPAADCHLARVDGVGSGGRGGRPARPTPRRAATSVGSMTRGPDLLAGVRHLAYGLVPVNARAHGASRTPSLR